MCTLLCVYVCMDVYEYVCVLFNFIKTVIILIEEIAIPLSCLNSGGFISQPFHFLL